MNKERFEASLLGDIPPRRPRETLGCFVIPARMLGKARAADLPGIHGECNFNVEKLVL